MDRLRQLFAVDCRALALVRMGYATIILTDLALRAPGMKVWMGPDGFYPAELARGMVGFVFSVHSLSDAMWLQWALFALAVLGGVSLLLGFWSRTSALVSWYLLNSLELRNMNMADVGDHVLVLCLFWLIFLPCGAQWSIDRRVATARGERPPNRVASVASAGLLIQIAGIVFVSALWKLQGTSWPAGNAVRLALSDDVWARPFGVWLLGHPHVTTAVTWATLTVESVGPLLLLFTPVRWQVYVRPVVLLGLLGFFVGVGSGIDLGLIPFIMGVSLLAFVPGPLLDRVFGPPAPAPEETDAAHEGVLGRIVHVGIPAVTLALMLVLSVDGFLPKPFFEGHPHNWIYSLNLSQHWSMYAPDPKIGSFRLIFVTTLEDGRVRSFALGGERPGWPPMETDAPLERIWDDYRMKMHVQDRIVVPFHPRAVESLIRWYCTHSSVEPVRVQLRKVTRRTRLAEPDAEIRSVVEDVALPPMACPAREPRTAPGS